MKFHLLLFCLLLSGALVKAQSWNNYATPGRNIWLPDSAGHSATSFATFIQSRYTDQREQLLAIYSWVTANIRYDDDSSYYFNCADEDTKVAATLRRRKGVCENFAALFTSIAVKTGIPAYVVHGYAGPGKSISTAAHSWCAVNLNDNWYLCDPTWDAGSSGNYQYFLVSPYAFVQTHMPFDPLWQLLENPVDYNSGNPSNAGIFNFRDSIKTFLQSDSLQQYLAIERRMKYAKKNKEMLRLWESYNRMHIAIIGGEENMRLYNAAVEDLNNATDRFNAFISYRNNGFIPVKPAGAIELMLEPVSPLIAAAIKKLDGIGQVMENFQYDTEALRRRLTLLVKRNQEQLLFLQKYFTTIPTERDQLMYDHK